MADLMTDEIAPGAASAEEAKLFHDLARRWMPLSDEIRRVHFRFGEDSDGSPAVWIIAVVPEDLKPSKEKIRALSELMESFKDDVHQSDTDRWPYTRIETE
jgi:hypothetical protein